MVQLLQDKEFAPYAFKLNYQRTLPLASEVANAVDLRYEMLFLRVKTKFHTN